MSNAEKETRLLFSCQRSATPRGYSRLRNTAVSLAIINEQAREGAYCYTIQSWCLNAIDHIINSTKCIKLIGYAQVTP